MMGSLCGHRTDHAVHSGYAGQALRCRPAGLPLKMSGTTLAVARAFQSQEFACLCRYKCFGALSAIGLKGSNHGLPMLTELDNRRFREY